jgi:HEAT repeat protein
MIYYCTQCWAEFRVAPKLCPNCGAQIEAIDHKRTYIEKLIRGLEHPEPQTPVRCAWILGQLQARAAVPALVRLVRESSDPYLVEAAVEALDKIGDSCALEVLQWAIENGSLRVRQRAAAALKNVLDGAEARA